jgi:hypothetical protein
LLSGLLTGVLPAQLGVEDGKAGRSSLGARESGREAAGDRFGGQATETDTATLRQRIKLAQPLLQRGAVLVGG